MTHALGAAALAVIYVALLALGLSEDLREEIASTVVELVVLKLGEDWREATVSTADTLILVRTNLILLILAFVGVLTVGLPTFVVSAHSTLNVTIHTLGRWLSVLAMAIMVVFILLQIVMRLFFEAPSWTEEGARFLMLWMVGLMAPIAWRQGGFVAIDMLERALGRVAAGLLGLLLLSIALWVLIVMSDKGWNNHVDSMTGRGNSATLRVPLDLIGGERIRFQNNWQYASLFTGTCLMIVVTVELILRRVLSLFGGDDRIEPIAEAGQAGAE